MRAVLFCILLSSLYCCNATAQNFGEVAASLYEPLSLVIQLVRAVSIICGSGLILGGILKYIDYRRNPIAVRLSAVLSMFFFGVALIIVGFLPLKTF
jgi:uncharacterized ion transporter superfamily protein YfcC